MTDPTAARGGGPYLTPLQGNFSLIRRRLLFGASESNISSRVKYWRPFFGQKVGRKRRTVARSWPTLLHATSGTFGAQSGYVRTPEARAFSESQVAYSFALKVMLASAQAITYRVGVEAALG